MERVLGGTLLIVWAVFVAALPARAEYQWAYEGRFGPDNWRHISPEFETCATGTQQSPVNLTGAVETSIRDITLHWNAADWVVHNTGYTLQVQAPDAGYAIIDGDRYELMQFNFHTPSEHAINGQHFPIEAQFVHVAKDNRIAVISIMFKRGGRNPTFEAIMAKAPLQPNDQNPLGPLNLDPLVTDIGDVLRYQGSLTTPPCSETVTWTILTDPLTVSDAAVNSFEILFGMNARPIQPLNRRYVLTD